MRFLFDRTQDGWHSLSSVIAGLDLAIHLSSQECLLRKRMDPRVKPAGDAGERVSAQPNDGNAHQSAWSRRGNHTEMTAHLPSRMLVRPRWMAGPTSPGSVTFSP